MAGGNTGGSYSGSSSDSVVDNLGNTVDTNGIPTIAGTGQTVGNSQNGAVQSTDCIDCTDGASTDGAPTVSDSDGDGVNDICDLDDDNDGILDTIECTSPAGSNILPQNTFVDAEGLSIAPTGWQLIPIGVPYSSANNNIGLGAN